MNHKVTIKWNLKAGLGFQKIHFFRYQGQSRAWRPSTHQFSRASTDDLPLPIPGREGREGEGRGGKGRRGQGSEAGEVEVEGRERDGEGKKEGTVIREGERKGKGEDSRASGWMFA